MVEECALGAHLRGLREALSPSADEVSEGTRIAPRLIVALESDHFEALPAPGRRGEVVRDLVLPREAAR